MSKKTHAWTKENDDQLLRTIEASVGIFDFYKQQNKRANPWDAIAGMLYPEITVTGAACKRRYDKIAKKPADSFAQISEKIEEYESDILIELHNMISEIYFDLTGRKFNMNKGGDDE